MPRNDSNQTLSNIPIPFKQNQEVNLKDASRNKLRHQSRTIINPKESISSWNKSKQ